jgi:hypothetical protein
MAKKKSAKKKTAKGAHRERYEREFDRIESEVFDREITGTVGIIRALRCVAMELSELNVAASELMSLPESLSTVVHHLEKIDAQTDEVAETTRKPKR